MLEFSTFGWIIIGICAVMVGFSKTGIPGAGILVVPLIAQAMPAMKSTGFLLPMLALADIMAIIYWRRHVRWGHLVRLLPWTLLGVLIGYRLMFLLDDRSIMPVIGVLVLVLIGVTWWRDSREDPQVPTYWWFAGVMGILAGSSSMVANAAGPIMIIYLLAMKLEKKEFVGTSAWFFWILNLSKMPFSSKLGLIDRASLMSDLAMLPFIILGGLLGIYLVHRIPQKPFNLVVKVLASLAAILLCLRPWLSGEG